MSSTTTAHQVHPKTGLPIQEVPTFKVGDLVTEGSMGDGYPGVVVAVTPKTVWVRGVNYLLGNVQQNDVPGYNGYGDSATLVIDPEDVKAEVAKGKEGASKYTLQVSRVAVTHGSLNDREKYGDQGFHRAAWRRPGGYGYLSMGARYRQDPHV